MSSFAEKQKLLKEQAAHEAIYEATLKVISRQQNDSLKMQDIAETAGIATGTLYNYFKNKVELLTFVDEKLRGIILNKVEQVSAFSLPAGEKLKCVIREIFTFSRDYHGVFDLADKFGIKATIPIYKKQEAINQAQDCFVKIIAEGIQQQQFRSVDAEQVAKQLFSTLIGRIEIQNWLQDYEVAKEADDLINFFLSYLTNRPT